jgi:uncharacterized protein (TIGR02452 family)
MTNFDRISVWQDTYTQFQHSPIPNTSKKYKHEDLININIKYTTTIVDVVNYDIIDVALMHRMQTQHNKVLLLNMADIAKPGGCVESGSGAQEECIFRRSDYYKHLTRNFYPIQDADIILSKNVMFIKHNETKGNPPMETPIKLDIMAIPALRFPQMDNTYNHYLYDSDYQIMKKKIDSMFKLGIQYNYDVLVLSAFGCGAYGNPPKIVVQIFRECLQKYKGCIKKVVFAILGANYNFFQELKGIYTFTEP